MKIRPVEAGQTDRHAGALYSLFAILRRSLKTGGLPRKRLTATGMHIVSGAMRTSLAVFPRVSTGCNTWKPYWIPLCLRSGFHNLVNVVCLVRGTPAARGRVCRYFGRFWTFCTVLTSPRGCCLLQTRSHCADPKHISWHEFVTSEFPLRDYFHRNTIWDAFAKQVRKATLSLVVSVRPSVCPTIRITATPTGRTFLTFD